MYQPGQVNAFRESQEDLPQQKYAHIERQWPTHERTERNPFNPLLNQRNLTMMRCDAEKLRDISVLGEAHEIAEFSQQLRARRRETGLSMYLDGHLTPVRMQPGAIHIS